MADGFGLAGVSAVLRRRVLDAFAAADVAGAIGLAPVTVMPPDRVVDDAEPTGVNLYLHQVTPNQGWRNIGQPTFTPDGHRSGAPPLGLDLHYLLTAYGAEPYHAEVLLGHAMLALHEFGVLGPAEIQAALAVGPPPPDPDIPDPVRTSGLAAQGATLTVTLEAMDPEASSRLWSAMQARYRMTAAFLVTVVLLESSATASPALPVATVQAVALPLERPLVHRVQDAADAAAPLLATATLAIVGERLVSGTGVTVWVDAEGVRPPGAALTYGRITLPLADLVTPLRAGVHTVQVSSTVDFGDPPVAHDALESAAVPFLLHPLITGISRVNDTVGPVAGVSRAAGTLQVVLDPPVGPAQRVRCLLHHLASREPAALAAPAGNGVVPPATEAGTLVFAYAGLRTGAHLVRVVVDGAESPVSGTPYDQPQVVI